MKHEELSLNPFFHKAHSFVQITSRTLGASYIYVSILFSIRLIHSKMWAMVLAYVTNRLNPFFHKAHSFEP